MARRRDATAAVSVVSVAEAAELLGISPGAVRKRIERGQLAGRKVGGQWQVVLGEDDATGHDTTTRQDATDDDEAALATVNAAARSQLEAIRDEWLQPLISQFREQAEAIGELRAERNAEASARAEAEIHRLAAEQARRDEAAQADQLVNLLEDRVRELERRLRADAASDA